MLELVLTVALILIGIVLLTKGADFLVDGAADFARYLRISPIIVGLTIVAIGTSLPELITSIMSFILGSYEIAVANVVGSNIANIGLIIGISALIYPLVVKTSSLLHEFPFMVFSTFFFIILAVNKFVFLKDTFALEWYDGIFLLATLGFFFYYLYKDLKKQRAEAKDFKKEFTHKNPLHVNMMLMTAGVILLPLGGRLFVSGSIDLAAYFGISESFIGLTLVALGTSLPELFTCVVAAWKKESEIVVGNIVGSNIFNILMVLGLISLFKTVPIAPMVIFVDSIVMLAFTLLFVVFATRESRVSRVEGAVLLSLYIIFIGYLWTRLY